MTNDGDKTVNLTISDHSALRPLKSHLTFMAPEAEIRVEMGQPGSGELGAEDVLVIIATSPVLIAAIKTLPDFLRARSSKPVIRMTKKGKEITITGANLDDAMPLLDDFLDD